MATDIAAVGLALAVVGLAAVVYRQELRLRDLARAWGDHDLAHDVGNSAGVTNDWGPSELGRVSEAVSRALPELMGHWSTVLVVSNECGECQAVLGGLDETIASQIGYRFGVLFTTEVGNSGPRDVPVGTDALLFGLPTPSVVLVDPGGAAVGGGSIATASEIVAFLTEGRQHGFGPDGAHPSTSEPHVH